MAGSDGAILLTTARWSDEHQYLHEVVKKGDLPQLVRIVKGHYLGLGVPTLPNPNLSSTAVVASAGTSLRVAVQCVKFKDNHKTVNVGPKLAIPEEFDGFFEILNEDGRAVRCIESVHELARKLPDSCLVRESVKVYVSRSDSPDAIGERTRTLAAGELLVLVGEVCASSTNQSGRGGVSGGSSSSSSTSASATGPRFLRCFDQRGEHVYLPMELRAKFSAVAREDNISGVHKIRNLLNKRLPLMVRMVSGRPPAGLKVGQQFCAEMRLLASFQEEIIVALPIVKDCGLAIIPPTVSLKLQLPANANSIKSSKEFGRLHERCLARYRSEMAHTVQVYDAHFSKNLRFDGQQWRVPVPGVPALSLRPPATSDLLDMVNVNGLHGNGDTPVRSVKDEGTEKCVEYDEIDQIYDYIRGFAPLPKHLKHSTYDMLNGNVGNVGNVGGVQKRIDQNRNLYNRVMTGSGKTRPPPQLSGKPAPPPLETMPTRKIPIKSAVAEEKEDGGSERSPTPPTPLVPKSLQQQPTAKPRMYRQRSAIPTHPHRSGGLYNKNHFVTTSATPSAALLSPAESKQSLTPSPLFNIRYKSMTNLLAADSDTLGSSQSGGRCSGGSAGSAAVRHPPHYLRSTPPPMQTAAPGHLHRPRSLTDLLWDIRWSKSPPKIQLHPTVVADVIPPSRASKSGASRGVERSKHQQDVLNRRRNSANLLNGSKKHTVFYRL